MAKVLLQMFWALLGIGLTYLGYGQKGLQVRMEMEIKPFDISAAIASGICCIIWGICLIDLIKGNHIGRNLLVVIGFMTLYGIWFINTRKTTKKLIKESKIPPTFERIQSMIPRAVLDECVRLSGNRKELEIILLHCASQGQIKRRHIPTLLDKFAP